MPVNLHLHLQSSFPKTKMREDENENAIHEFHDSIVPLSNYPIAIRR